MGLEQVPHNVVTGRLEDLVRWARRNSVFPATFGLACCALEMMATGAAHYDLARYGMEVFRASPRQADLMIVAGRVSNKMAPVLRQVYDQMVDPKWVISMGVCASSGGMFNNYAIVQGVDHIVPVDMYLPGCPPRPEMLIDAILRLHEKVMHEPLGDRRRRSIEARVERDGAPLVAPGEMPSSYRFDRARRAEWLKAAANGREEQLRIEKWMAERARIAGAAPSRGGSE
jgi:NADH-quinone oxidoreductase subunit B